MCVCVSVRPCVRARVCVKVIACICLTLGDLKVAKVFLPVITMNKKAKVPVVSGVTMLRDSFFTYNSSGQKEDINQSFDISPKELRHLIRILMGVPNP